MQHGIDRWGWNKKLGDRLAATEIRLKKAGGAPKKKKKNEGAPMLEPDSKPFMQLTASL